MRVDELVAPENDAELFDADPEALHLKPVMTGDVFTNVDTAGDDLETIIIVGHPCVIRGSRGKLARRVPCAAVKQMSDPLPYPEWPQRRWDKLPLASTPGLDDHSAAALLEWRSVHKSKLLRSERRLTMTERGVYVLQQRFTHAITRCAVPVADFEASSKHVMREAELEFEWVAELVPDGTDEKHVQDLTEAFHDFLDEDDRRALIRPEGGESQLRSQVRTEIKHRRGGQAPATPA